MNSSHHQVNNSIHTLLGKCAECGAPLNERGYCLACYERVVLEKPLIAWREDKLKKPCTRCGKIFQPTKQHWEYCPECWPLVRDDVLSKREA